MGARFQLRPFSLRARSTFACVELRVPTHDDMPLTFEGPHLRRVSTYFLCSEGVQNRLFPGRVHCLEVNFPGHVSALLVCEPRACFRAEKGGIENLTRCLHCAPGHVQTQRYGNVPKPELCRKAVS